MAGPKGGGKQVIALVAYLVAIVGVGLAIHAIAPFASYALVVTALAITGAVIGFGLAWWVAPHTPMAIGIAVFFGAGMATLGGIKLFDLTHDVIGVFNGHAERVVVEIDGHEIGEVDPYVGVSFTIPSGASEIVASEIIASDPHVVGKSGVPPVIDRASLDAPGDGPLVFDIGGKSCFGVTLVQYGLSAKTPSNDAMARSRVGDRHVFRTYADFVFEEPAVIRDDDRTSDHNEAQQRTLLVAVSCDESPR